MEDKLRRLNMMAELVQMKCSMMGAWGKATPDGKLIQYRTLDFGDGPFANDTFLIVHHPTDSEFKFASLTFPGLAGIVTSFSEKMAQSEASFEYPKHYTDRIKPKGSYFGLTETVHIREMIQFAHNVEEAAAIDAKRKRTWPLFLAYGDYESHTAKVLLHL